MFILDFNHTSKHAFLHGFLKGLAAPVSLYHQEPAPPVPAVHLVVPTCVSAADALASDWKKIGADMRTVIDRYAKEAAV